jgi:putative membrane protein
MRLLLQILTIARLEASFFRRYPRTLVTGLVVALIPALYSLLYLASIWDPTAHTGALSVALVNLDQGVKYREHDFNMGQDMVARLKARHVFGFIDEPDEQTARTRVRQGQLAFALIIPRDFSSNAVPGAQAGAGKLVVYTSEGNSYQAAGLARRFAEELGHEVNERLNERRWALVLTNATGSRQSLQQLNDGVRQLQLGADELAKGAAKAATGAESVNTGASQLQQGVGQLSAGVKELGTGLQAIESKRPRRSELKQLKAGSEVLTQSHAELGRGLTELRSGSQRLQDSVLGFQGQAQQNSLLPAQETATLAQVAQGVSGLSNGLQVVADTQLQLADGAVRLNDGVGRLTTGVTSMNSALRGMLSRMPDERQLDDLSSGSKMLSNGTASLAESALKVSEGSRHVATGLGLLAESLPAPMEKMDGSAQGLASSVQPVVEVDAAVFNNGSGYAPTIIPAALWLGAGIVAFLCHVRVLPRQVQRFSQLGKVLGKISLPVGLVVVQALLVMLCARYWLHIPMAHPWAFALTLVVAATTFLLIIYALTLALGDAGKGLALLFFAVQLTSSGSIVPVELSGGLFLDISPWLPLTWVVRGIKASLFDAYGGAWQPALLLVAMAAALAVALACAANHWRFVRVAKTQPSVRP